MLKHGWIVTEGTEWASDRLPSGRWALGFGGRAGGCTSMAGPHIAGVAALCKAKNPTASSEDSALRIAEQSTTDVLKVSRSSPNRLPFTTGL